MAALSQATNAVLVKRDYIEGVQALAARQGRTP
jgi:hypothetical protein